jgi:putative membrane protein
MDLSIIALVIAVYTFGLIGHLQQATLPWMLAVTPYVLTVAGIIVLSPFISMQRPTFWLWCVGTYLWGFSVEVLGIATGAVFGQYTYGQTLGFSAWGVPLVIGLNWLLVILGAVAIAGRFVRNPVLFVAFAGALVVLFDYVMEPAAIRLDYWTWSAQDIPVRNYIAWFTVSTIPVITFYVLRLHLSSPVPVAYFLVQLSFFLALRLYFA